MYEANAGVDLGLVAELIAFVAIAFAPRVASKIEVVRSRYAVLQVIDSAAQREPVEILGLGLAGLLVVETIDPAGECLVCRDAAKGRLPEMAVGGEEAG